MPAVGQSASQAHCHPGLSKIEGNDIPGGVLRGSTVYPFFPIFSKPPWINPEELIASPKDCITASLKDCRYCMA